MRCPECLTRNSVAAKKCGNCGQKLPSKGPSKVVLGIAGSLVVLLALAVGLFLTIPKFADPEQNLSRIARKMADGPATPQEAQAVRKEFEDAIKKYLERKGGTSSSSLAGNLHGLLPDSAFEAHVIDLPRGLKLVEIDTVLHASAFLIMKGTNDTKVFPLPGVEVFDDARIISDEAGPMLVILAHSGGQPPHRPQVRAYAILPDNIIDESEKVVPTVIGEGHGKFSKNDRDLYFELTLPSIASADNIDIHSLKLNSEQIVKQYLVWKDAKYQSRYEYGNQPMALSIAFARLLGHTDLLGSIPPQLGAQATGIARDYSGRTSGPYALSGAGGKSGEPKFAVLTGDRRFTLSWKLQSGKWTVVNVENSVNSTNLASSGSGERDAKQEPVRPDSTKPDSAVPGGNDEKVAAANFKPAQENMVMPGSAPGDSPASSANGVKNSAAGKAGKQETVASQPTKTADKSAADRTAADKGAGAKNNESGKKGRSDAGSVEPGAAGSSNNTVTRAKIASYLSAPSVRMRTGPNTDKKAVTEIPKGEDIDILGQKDGWYKVRYRGQDGYVYGGFVDTKKADAYTTAVVTRAMPVTDKGSKTLFTPQAGDRLIILSGINNNRYKVRLSDGRVGYVDKHALDVNVEAPELVP